MLYAIIGRDAPGSLARRRATRARHLERLKALIGEGRLVAAGPLPAIDAEDPGPAGFVGSLIVAEFASLAAARTWADQDPYVEERVYASVEVLPYLKVLP